MKKSEKQPEPKENEYRIDFGLTCGCGHHGRAALVLPPAGDLRLETDLGSSAYRCPACGTSVRFRLGISIEVISMPLTTLN